jgi:hypothetical protein
MALIINSVDIGSWPGGMTSAMHDAEDMERTVTAFRRAIALLKEERDI